MSLFASSFCWRRFFRSAIFLRRPWCPEVGLRFLDLTLCDRSEVNSRNPKRTSGHLDRVTCRCPEVGLGILNLTSGHLGLFRCRDVLRSRGLSVSGGWYRICRSGFVWSSEVTSRFQLRPLDFPFVASGVRVRSGSRTPDLLILCVRFVLDSAWKFRKGGPKLLSSPGRLGMRLERRALAGLGAAASWSPGVLESARSWARRAAWPRALASRGAYQVCSSSLGEIAAWSLCWRVAPVVAGAKRVAAACFPRPPVAVENLLVSRGRFKNSRLNLWTPGIVSWLYVPGRPRKRKFSTDLWTSWSWHLLVSRIVLRTS